MEQTQAQPQALSDKQREAFARILADAKKQAQAKVESDYSLLSRIKNELAPQIAKERGALPLVKKIRSLQRKLDALENALTKLGFDCDEDSISIHSDPPKAVEYALEAAVEAARKERDDEFKKFDFGILRVWRVDSATEAQIIVEALL
ncbi:MAG TPA: hypothetical protein VE422_30795 [Terriglobia bacterium]|nr:hypothetical protein [Terriglobia bacterium]